MPPRAYPGIRGAMTWSINWDASNNWNFARTVKPHLDPALASATTTSPDLPGASRPGRAGPNLTPLTTSHPPTEEES